MHGGKERQRKGRMENAAADGGMGRGTDGRADGRTDERTGETIEIIM